VTCFARDGAQTVFWGRFSAILHTSSALLAGISHLPYPRFPLWNAAGGCLWTLTFSGLMSEIRGPGHERASLHLWKVSSVVKGEESRRDCQVQPRGELRWCQMIG